jgi:hypothetical protein
MTFSILFLAAAVLAQADDIPRLIERLRSDSIEEREAAAAKLKDLGRAAAPALEKAASGPDVESAGRARRILAVIDVREKLPAALLKGRPGIDERLAGGGAAWTRELLDLAQEDPLHPGGLKWKDLDILLAPAVRGAATPKEKQTVLNFLQNARTAAGAAAAELLLEDPDDEVRFDAASTVVMNDGVAAILASARLLRKGGGEQVAAAEHLATSLDWSFHFPKFLALFSSADPAAREDYLKVVRKASRPILTPLLTAWIPEAEACARLRLLLRP